MRLGLHIGNKKSTLNLNNGAYIKGFRHNVNIFDIENLLQSFKFLFFGLSEIFKKRNKFMFINPSIDLFISYFIKKNSKKYPFINFYISSIINVKWVNGILSNWKSIENLYWWLRKKKSELEIPNLRKLKKLTKFVKYYNTLKNLSKTRSQTYPDFVILLKNDKNAMIEINSQKLPMLGIINTDMDPNLFLYKTFGNINNISSLHFFLNFLKISILKARLQEQKLFIQLIIYFLKKNAYNKKSF